MTSIQRFSKQPDLTTLNVPTNLRDLFTEHSPPPEAPPEPFLVITFSLHIITVILHGLVVEKTPDLGSENDNP